MSRAQKFIQVLKRVSCLKPCKTLPSAKLGPNIENTDSLNIIFLTSVPLHHNYQSLTVLPEHLAFDLQSKNIKIFSNIKLKFSLFWKLRKMTLTYSKQQPSKETEHVLMDFSLHEHWYHIGTSEQLPQDL